MKMSPEEFSEKKNECIARGLSIGTVWQHYKGGTYAVNGYGIDTESGLFKVGYHRIGGPDFDPIKELGINFYRVPEEWFMTAYKNNCETQRFTRL